MRVSLVARLISHPSIEFGSRRHGAHHRRLGLERPQTVYHRPRSVRLGQATVGLLRPETSRFRFPSMGRLGGAPARRVPSPFGPPRARRA